jgi:MFS family permease
MEKLARSSTLSHRRRAAGQPMTATTSPAPVRLGLRANLPQFILLVAVNALVGGMVGQERTVLPLLAGRVFGVGAFTATLAFIVAFGVTKALTNLVAGTLSDRYGRKPVLVAGWLIGVPVPLLLIWAPSWGWIIAANVLLGVNQGLTWSTTIVMKIDLVGPARRGLAMGFNEAAGYFAVAATGLATGYLAASYGLRPAPFLLGLAFAALGLGLSTVSVRETHHHARHEARTHTPRHNGHREGLTGRQIFTLTSFRERALSAASQAGLVNNLNDGLAWGLFPILFATSGLGVTRIGALVAIYPAVWSIGQLVTGGLSDRWGRKWFIASGMLLQAVGIGLVAAGSAFAVWALAAALMGAGTAMVYPTLLAVIGDVAHPTWRARAVGAYRLWRDLGYAAGALIAGITADALGVRAAIWVVAAITAASGLVVAIRMYETHQRATTQIGADP